MRSIKFRSWNGREFGYFQNGKYDELFEWGEAQQATGLTDKQGVEIYEGDLVNFIPMDMFGVVKVFNKSLCFGLEWVNSKTEIFTQLFYLECEQELEVIGNIYEDSHLLLETAK